jgi:hypothetical protein
MTCLNMRDLTLECKIFLWPMFRMWELVLAVLFLYAYGGIHNWGTTFGTKDLRISVFIVIYYYLINKI